MYRDHTGVNHASDGVTYDQVAYHCTADNWWVTVESPQEAS